MAVIIDIIDGATLTEDANGIVTTRIAIVTGLTGTPSRKLFDATSVGGIPPLLSFHPSIPLIQLVKKTVSAIPSNAEKAEVFLEYKLVPPEEQEPDETQPPVITIGSTTQTVNANRFIEFDGQQNLMIVEYKRKPDSNSTEEVLPEKQTGEVQKQIPATFFRLTRKEESPPLRKSKDFVGRVQVDSILNDPARAWLCTRIEGVSIDAGVTYIVDYEFQRAISENVFGEPISGWDATVTWIDPDTGFPPPDIFETGQQETAIKTFEIYPAEDFRLLDLGVDLL